MNLEEHEAQNAFAYVVAQLMFGRGIACSIKDGR